DTAAKRELVDLAQDSPVAFHDALYYGDVPHVTQPRTGPIPGLTNDWYSVYQRWCTTVGVKPASLKRFLNVVERRRGLRAERKRYQQGQSLAGPHSVLLFGQAP